MVYVTVYAHEADACDIALCPEEGDTALKLRVKEDRYSPAQQVVVWMSDQQLHQLRLALEVYLREREGKGA